MTSLKKHCDKTVRNKKKKRRFDLRRYQAMKIRKKSVNNRELTNRLHTAFCTFTNKVHAFFTHVWSQLKT